MYIYPRIELQIHLFTSGAGAGAGCLMSISHVLRVRAVTDRVGIEENGCPPDLCNGRHLLSVLLAAREIPCLGVIS